jgi:hypothetical protein
MEIYANLIREQGRRVITTSIVRLRTEDGVRELLEFVGIDQSLLSDQDFSLRRGEKVNQKSEMKRGIGATPLSAAEMIKWANEVDTRIAARRS